MKPNITDNDGVTPEFYFSRSFPKKSEKNVSNALSHLLFKKSAFFSLAK